MLRLYTLVIVVSVLCIAGCGGTQIAPTNRKMLEGLQTAVSSKNSDWLKVVAQQLDEKRTKGEISSAEFQSFDAIIQPAKAGDWDTALKRVFALSEVQRPTAEELARLRERKQSTK